MRSRLLLSVALALVAPLAACAATAQPISQDDDAPPTKKKSSTKKTSTDEDETTPSDDSPSPSPSSTSTTTPAPTSPSTPTDPPPSNQCGGKQGDACIDCCVGGNDQASAAADQAFESCICQSACASACGSSLCKGGQPSAACQQCMQGTGGQQCETAWVNACNANAACRAIEQCIQTSCGGGN